MLPHVIVHNEMSLDARTDGLDVDMGRFYRLAATWHEDCTLVGSETLLAGMPELGMAQSSAAGGESPDRAAVPAEPSGNEVGSGRPLLAAIDSRGRLPGLALLRDQPYWRDVVAVCSDVTPASHLDVLAAAKVSAIVAGGARVGALLRAGLVNEVSVVIEPRLVGGESHHWLVRAPDAGQEDVVALA